MTLIINWSDFTPLASLIGGALIGASSVILLATKGRILGISGIVGSLLQRANTPQDHYRWRIYFIGGIFLAAVIGNIFNLIPKLDIGSEYSTLIVGGLLVGLGTRMGSGCTSGHAVCGLGRLSPRSLVATLTFMASGFLTAFVFYHLI
jgi:hypothetical protein